LALGCGGHLTALRRLSISQFELSNAYTLPQLEAINAVELDACLLPVDCMLQALPRITLDAVELHRMAQGQRLGKAWGVADGLVRLYSDEQFVGVGDVLGTRLAPSRLIARAAKSAANKAVSSNPA
jgi:tRNA pseudouridine55 synthase